MRCTKARVISMIVTLDTGNSTGGLKRIYLIEEDSQLIVDFFENGMTEISLGCAVSYGSSEGYHVRAADIYRNN